MDRFSFLGCELNPKIVYTEFSAVVRKQKEILKKLIEKKQNQIRKIHPGLTYFRDGVKDIPIESIPGELYYLLTSPPISSRTNADVNRSLRGWVHPTRNWQQPIQEHKELWRR